MKSLALGLIFSVQYDGSGILSPKYCYREKVLGFECFINRRVNSTNDLKIILRIVGKNNGKTNLLHLV